ncbi:alpha/beta fold hydrolase [Streptomyces sp. S.PB5]|uniref:thioesterase II family protein n=1 Tax=Streptomyces sp. S.PB5 TaxID=3020844 RepID=UPI0025B23F70|nr:alpha/beta fold hydrolase [Streptomyces sp. S.PB5]MDN3026497.1 alpha/beta fold hydrolase [Streptomyces sp. S.PB5]
MTRSSWLRVFDPRPAPRLRLFCFPHAGGAASAFHPLAALLPEEIEVVAVQYPGRQDRYGEPMPRSMGHLVAEVTDAVAGRLDLPAAFLGHSMGATVAFETARRLRATHPVALRRLFASARRAPHIDTGRALDFADDAAAMAYIDALGGTGAELLKDADLRDLVLPVLRADFRLIAGYRYVPGAPLTCPITAIAGDSDASFALTDAAQWNRHTIAGCETRELPGGHFYLEDEMPALAALVLDALAADLPAPQPPARSL